MKKKYQVFVSSTYLDLLEERQKAVSAILDAGHIPAGMELFMAGNRSQLNTIYKWIDDSDIFMLILGGRYGSIDSKSKFSYVELEYKYALEKKKPVFSLVLEENYLREKASFPNAPAIFEEKNIKKYNQFKKIVEKKIVRYIKSPDEIAGSVRASLDEIVDTHLLRGWIRYNDAYESLAHGIQSMRELGIADIFYNHNIPNIPDEEAFRNAKSIKILFTSGQSFFRAFNERLMLALENDAEIKVILAAKQSDYVRDIEEMQTHNPAAYNNNDIDHEIEQAKGFLKGLCKITSRGTVLLSQFNTQLRGNIFILDDKLAFYSPILLPKLPRQTMTILLNGGALFNDCNLHFDTLFSVLREKGAVEKL